MTQAALSRRTVLSTIGGLAASSFTGITGADPGDSDDDLRLFSEIDTGEQRGARDVIPQGNYGFIADNVGMTVVDWRNPNNLEIVAQVEGRGDDIADVKIDGDLAGLAANGGTGVTFFDVSDPTEPTELGFYDAGSGIHNHYIEGEYAYLCVNNSTLIDVDGDGEIGPNDEIIVFGESRMEVVDISDPTSPDKVGEWRLKNHFPSLARAWINVCHDIVIADGLAYIAWWDAGVFVLDVTTPAEPRLVSHFDESPVADNEIGAVKVKNADQAFPLERYVTLAGPGGPGDAHLAQPSPDGDYVYVNAETYPHLVMDDPAQEEYGGIRIYDVTDFNSPERVARIDPPHGDDFRTSHNFVVTNNRLHSAWYAGGVRVFDVTNPTSPTELARYDPSGVTFDTAARSRSFTPATVRGEGLVLLHDDRGEDRPPAIGDGASPSEPPVSNSADDA